MKPNRILTAISTLVVALAQAFSSFAPARADSSAAAATYNVDRTDDTIVSACTAAPNDCTLRGAIIQANANPGSTVQIQYNQTYTLTDAGLFELILTADMTLTSSPGICFFPPCATVIQGGPGWSNRLVSIPAGVTVEILGITLKNGSTAGWGGAIHNLGTLKLSGSVVAGSQAVNGGGVYNGGSLTLVNSLVSGNSTIGYGGGIFHDGPTLAITTTQVISNSAEALGGGLFSGEGQVTAYFATFQGNEATGADALGGGIVNGANSVMTLDDSQIISNTAVGLGGGVFNYANALTLNDTTVSGNVACGGGGVNNNGGTLVITGGLVSDNTSLDGACGGGGIRTNGSAALTGVTLSGNQAPGGGGGGIAANDFLTLTNSSLHDNLAGNSGGGIFLSGPGALVTLDATQVISNQAIYGGGLAGWGTALVTNGSAVDGNQAIVGGGFNIFSTGAVTIDHSSVSDNTISGGAPDDTHGGGIFNDGALTIVSGTLADNRATNGSGGAIFVTAAGALTATNSTLSGNWAAVNGGGLSNNGVAGLFNVTLAGNTADHDGDGSGDGGGLFNAATLSAANTLVGGNFDLGGESPDCNGALNSLGHNLIQNAAGCAVGGDVAANVTGQSPNLGPLQGNGGPTQTHALLGGSPAIDAGPLVGCLDSLGAPLAVDQRGSARPAGARCDIGAFEYQAAYVVFLPLVVQ